MANISRSKENQSTKFGQLIECDITKIFLKNHTQNMVKKLVPDPFLKNWNWAYLWINSLKFYTVCFYCMASWGLSKYIDTKLQTTCSHLILSFFLNTKRGLELTLPASFSAWFLKKNIFIIFYKFIKFHCLIASTLWDIGQYVYWNCV